MANYGKLTFLFLFYTLITFYSIQLYLNSNNKEMTVITTILM